MGALTVSGAGAQVNTANSGMDVGELGRGSLLISQGGSVATGAKFATDSALVVGGASGVSGGITVTDTGSSIDSAGQVVIGQAGSGQLVIQNAATAITGGSTLVPSQGIDAGEQAGGAGNILVTGAGSLLKNTGSFIVGDAGIGSLSIEAGAVVITTPGTTGFGGMMIGDTASSGGSSVSLIGAGSSLSVTGLLDVGNAGSGALTLTGGATVTAGSLDAGIISTAVAQIGVSGAGTELSVAGTATIADDGTGVLSVLNGATFLAASLTIGTQGDSSGALVISGAGSVVDLTGSLNIGTALGTGALTIGPGAVVNASVIDLQGGVVLEGGLLDPTVYIENGGSTTGGFGTIASDYILLEGTILSNGSKSGKETEVVEGTIVGGGTADIKGSVSVNGPGILQIGTHDTIELTGAVLNAATTTFTDNLTPTGTYSVNNSVIDVVFQDSTGVLQIDDIAGFAGTVATWKAGDQFVITGGTLSDLNVSNGDTLTFSDSGTGAGAGGIDSIIFGAAIGAGAFGIVNGNTVQAVACFAEGTQIDTEDGWVAVEDLGVGDQVMLADGEREPIVWIGQRDVRCLSHPVPKTVWPVRVSAGAFGEAVPRRDLYLSPDHAVFVDGVLVPVKFLINGSSIVQVHRDRVRYFHVELAEHAVILAEGLPVESYLDIGDRLDFGQNGVMRLHPDFGARLAADIALAWEARGVAPLVMTGEALAGARRLRA
jgi:T5SS/PEP-CTERM-associated repeat protein